MTARKQPGSKKPRKTKSNAAKAAEQQKATLNAASKENLNVDEIIETAQVEETETEKDVLAGKQAVEAVQKPETMPVDKPAETEPEKQPDDGFLYLNKKPKFWRNKVYVPDVGIVSGQVKKEHFKRFFALAPKTVKLERWLADSDTVQERIDTARKKMKSRATPNKE